MPKQGERAVFVVPDGFCCCKRFMTRSYEFVETVAFINDDPRESQRCVDCNALFEPMRSLAQRGTDILHRAMKRIVEEHYVKDSLGWHWREDFDKEAAEMLEALWFMRRRDAGERV